MPGLTVTTATARSDTSQSDLSQLKRTADGAFDRVVSTFRDTISSEPGARFPPEKGRYRLYVCLGCPWATRTIIVRSLMGLEDIIPVTVTSPRMDAMGWPFAKVDAFPGAHDDPLYGSEHIKDLYLRAEPSFSGRFTVPVLWDSVHQTIVNNESSEIIRMFYHGFDSLNPVKRVDHELLPEEWKGEIDEVNAWVYDLINNGVYKAGFATSQSAYEAAVYPLFDALDRVEKMLEGREYLVGTHLTEADVRLFVTIIRFDPAYYTLFKCNIRDIRHGYPNIHRWMQHLYWNIPAFKDNTDFDHIVKGYFNTAINPTKVVPAGPIPYILPLSESRRNSGQKRSRFESY